MGKYRHYGSHGYLMARPPLVEKGNVWWEDFTFTPMAKSKGGKRTQEFLTATALLPERLLIPMGGRTVYHWVYLEQKEKAPEAVATWVRVQNPQSSEPMWYIPDQEAGNEGATLLNFLAPVDPARSEPNIGFVWLPTIPGDWWESREYLYADHLWLVTLRPIPARAFLRANVSDAFAFYSWSPDACELARQYERERTPEAPRPRLLLGGACKGIRCLPCV